jgi:hypothetical protein
MNELIFDAELKGGRELPAQRWNGRTAIVAVSSSCYEGEEGLFGADVVLEWQDTREGASGRWEHIARFDRRTERRIALAPGLLRFRVDARDFAEPRRFRLSVTDSSAQAA